MTGPIRVATLATVSLLAIGHAQFAYAQDDDAGQEIIVTGTNIRGAPVIGSPIQTMDAAAIAKSGRATLADLMRDLPVNFAGGVANPDGNRGGQDSSSAAANLTGGAGINLRGLGSLSTLVLVNGRRVALSGQFGDFVDISNIPTNAIERIEILQDGASAVYGSDAVGGVANIVLKKRQKGFDATGRIGVATRGGEMEYQGGLSYGRNWNSGGFVVGYEYNRRANVLANDRGFKGGNLSSYGGVNWPAYTSRAGAAANIFSGNAAYNGAVAYTVPQGDGTGLTVADLTPATGGMGNSFDPWSDVDIVPEMERHSLFAAFDQEVSDSLTLRVDGRYTHRKGKYNLGYLAYYGTVPTTNPAYISGVTNNFGVLIDDLVQQRKVKVDSLAFNAGSSWSFAPTWTMDLGVSYSQERQNRYQTALRDSNVIEKLSTGAAAPSSVACSLMGTVASPTTAAQAYCNSLGYETWNPYSTQPLSDTLYNQLVGYEDLTFTSRVLQATLKVDGSLIDLPGGALKVATGIDWRREKIDGELTFNYRSIDDTTVPYGATSQNVFAAFGELSLPLFSRRNAIRGIANLDFSAAIRHERSNDLSGFRTTNPKFGFRYAPVEGFNLRGSWGTSFHTPPMRYQFTGVQPVNGGNAIFYANSFYTAPCTTTLVALNGYSGTPGGSGNCSFTGMVVAGGTSAKLKPEKARSWSLGFDIEPPQLPNFRASVNYYHIKIKDRLVRITSGSLAGILSSYFATGSSPYISNLDFNPDDAVVQALMDDPRFTGLSGPGPTRTASQIQAIIYATQMNLASLRMDGFDLAASYGFDVGGIGRLSLFGNGTIVSSYDVQSTPGGAYESKLGVYESTGNPVNFRGRAGIEWNSGGFSAQGTVNHTASYKCRAGGCYVASATGAPTVNTQDLRIGSWTTFDLRLSYAFPEGGSVLGGTRLTLGATNLFDKDPPFVDTGRIVSGNAAEVYDASNATIYGRTVSLTVNKSF